MASRHMMELWQGVCSWFIRENWQGTEGRRFADMGRWWGCWSMEYYSYIHL